MNLLTTSTIVTVVLLLAGLTTAPMASPEAARAQGDEQTATAEVEQTATAGVQPTATAVAESAPTVATTSPAMSAEELRPFGIGIAVLIIVCLVVLFSFLTHALNKYYESAMGLAYRGIKSSAKIVQAFTPAGVPAITGQAAQDGTPAVLTIQGPSTVTVGVLSDEYTAQLDQTLAGEVQWSVEPATAAAINPVGAATAKIVAATAGVFTVTATHSGAPVPALFQVVAITAPANGVELPFLGRAFGTLVALILLIAAVAFLALWGTLNGQAVATFVGGVLGYIFGVRNPASTGGAGASGTTTTGGTLETD